MVPAGGEFGVMVWFELIPVAFVAMMGIIALYAMSSGPARQRACPENPAHQIVLIPSASTRVRSERPFVRVYAPPDGRIALIHNLSGRLTLNLLCQEAFTDYYIFAILLFLGRA
jgi:hypothetical protein